SATPRAIRNCWPTIPALKPRRNSRNPPGGIMIAPRRKSPPNAAITPRTSLFREGAPMTDKAAIPDAWSPLGGAKEDPGRPASGERHERHTFFEVAVAAKKIDGFPDEGLRVQRDEVRLVLVDALVVNGIDGPRFLRGKSKVGKALA